MAKKSLIGKYAYTETTKDGIIKVKITDEVNGVYKAINPITNGNISRVKSEVFTNKKAAEKYFGRKCYV